MLMYKMISKHKFCLFLAMIDNLGGSVRVNNLLSTLNLKPIYDRNFRQIEERPVETIETFATDLTRNAAHGAFDKEMSKLLQYQ